MRAMVIEKFGGPEVFEEKEVPQPQPGVNQVLVKIYATSVNPVDYKIRGNRGRSQAVLPLILGFDVAGVVEAVGPGVKTFIPGDEVFYSPVIGAGQGSYAEYHVADESIVAFKPKDLDFVQAAALPLAGCTAWDAIISFMKIRTPETILIHAGAGGVGSLAVQMARACGARVLATCRPANAELVRSLGAAVTIDYRTEDFVQAVLRETDGRGVDAVFDTVGGDTLARSIQAVKPHGRLASIVNTTGDLNRAYGKNLVFYFEMFERARHKLDELRLMVERGQICPVIDSVLSLEDLPEAHRKLEAGGVRGKIVLKIRD